MKKGKEVYIFGKLVYTGIGMGFFRESWGTAIPVFLNVKGFGVSAAVVLHRDSWGQA